MTDSSETTSSEALPSNAELDAMQQMLRAELRELTQQTHELTMNHAAAMVEIGTLRQLLVETHQRACVHAIEGSQACLQILELLEHGWADLKTQRTALAPTIKTPMELSREFIGR